MRVTANEACQRLDHAATGWLGWPRSQVVRGIKLGLIKLNGELVKPGIKLSAGDQILYQPSEMQVPAVQVLYEDGWLMVVEKPAGMMVHPTGKLKVTGTLADFAKDHTDDNGSDRPGIVHRLDKDTSGLVIIAKTAEAKAKLQRLFADRKVEKEYLALVNGRPVKPSATIDLPIGPGTGIKRAIDPGGRPASTKYETIKDYPTTTLLRIRPKTGRTHQIRVHMAAIGHPVVGDNLYGPGGSRLKRQFLHAHRLGFKSPSGQWVDVISPLPKDLKDYLSKM